MFWNLLFTLTIITLSVVLTSSTPRDHKYAHAIWKKDIDDIFGVSYHDLMENCKDKDELMRLINEATDEKNVTLQDLTDLYDKTPPTELLENFLIKAYWIKHEIFPSYQSALQLKGETLKPAAVKNKILLPGSFEGLYVTNSFLQEWFKKLPNCTPEAVQSLLRPHLDSQKKADIQQFYSQHQTIIPHLVWKQILELTEKSILSTRGRDEESLIKLARFINITHEELAERTQAEVARIRAKLRKEWEAAVNLKQTRTKISIAGDVAGRNAQKETSWFMYYAIIVIIISAILAIVGISIYFNYYNTKKSENKE